MIKDFLEKIKEGVLLVVAKPDQLHVLQCFDDYSENSDSVRAFWGYRYSTPSEGTVRLYNSTLNREPIYIYRYGEILKCVKETDLNL